MRKYINILTAVALAVAASLSLTACGDDDEPDPEPQPPVSEKTVSAAELTASFYVNEAILNTFDILAKSSTGEELEFSTTPTDFAISDSETLPMYVMQVKSTGKAVPLTAIMSINFTLRDGYTVPEKSDFALATCAGGKITYTDGTSDNFNLTNQRSYNKGVLGSKIDLYTTSLNKKFGNIQATLTRQGISFDAE